MEKQSAREPMSRGKLYFAFLNPATPNPDVIYNIPISVSPLLQRYNPTNIERPAARYVLYPGSIFSMHLLQRELFKINANLYKSVCALGL